MSTNRNLIRYVSCKPDQPPRTASSKFRTSKSLRRGCALQQGPDGEYVEGEGRLCTDKPRYESAPQQAEDKNAGAMLV